MIVQPDPGMPYLCCSPPAAQSNRRPDFPAVFHMRSTTPGSKKVGKFSSNVLPNFMKIFMNVIASKLLNKTMTVAKVSRTFE
jgi:hypothetical protein